MADKQKQNLISHIRQLSVLTIVSAVLQLASYYPANQLLLTALPAKAVPIRTYTLPLTIA